MGWGVHHPEHVYYLEPSLKAQFHSKSNFKLMLTESFLQVPTTIYATATGPAGTTWVGTEVYETYTTVVSSIPFNKV